jgi:purine nucleoside phosphorylase
LECELIFIVKEIGMNAWNKECLLTCAKEYADEVRRSFGVDASWKPQVGVVLGTGWGRVLKDHLIPLSGSPFPLKRLELFSDLGDLPGHERAVLLGTIEGVTVAALSGRVHLNEGTGTDIFAKVRMQIELLYALGIKSLILTNAAGSLRDCICAGDVMRVTKLMTLHAPDMPLFTGEFHSPEDLLRSSSGNDLADRLSELDVRNVAFAMVRGPFFEGRCVDKTTLQREGADTVGMSILPELCVASTKRFIPVVALNFITNSDAEVHSHEVNQQRAAAAGAKLGALIRFLIAGRGD